MCKFNWHIFSKLIMDCREKFLKCPKPLAIAATGLCWPIRSNRWSRRRTPSTKFYSGRFHPEIQSLWCPFREPLWEKTLCSDGSRPWAKVGGKGGEWGWFCFSYPAGFLSFCDFVFFTHNKVGALKGPPICKLNNKIRISCNCPQLAPRNCMDYASILIFQ